jgi:putative ABC transport system permease protein
VTGTPFRAEVESTLPFRSAIRIPQSALSAMITDIRQAFRRLIKSPGFTIIAALTLALGLGANITVFSMMNEFLLRPLHVERPEELVFLMQKNPKLEVPYGFSYADYRDMRASMTGAPATEGSPTRPFSGLLAEAMFTVNLGEAGQIPERAWVHAVSDNYFEVLGVRAARGRLFRPDEATRAGADPIVVLGNRYWLEHFNGDPHVVGQTINLNGAPFTVVGIAPERFGGTEAMVQASMFVPATMYDILQPGQKGALERRGNTVFLVMGRLHPGVSAGQAREALQLMITRLLADYPDDHAPATARVVPEIMSRPSPHVSDFSLFALVALMVLAALVLAVAAANIANLLYARAAEAERVLAIRSSLGATRWRLVRYMLSESVLIALAAAVLGWFAADAFGQVLSGFALSADNPPTTQPTLDWRPPVFTLFAALVTGIATGLFPALRATRRDMLPLLNESTRSFSGARHPLRSLLVCGQVALSCVVLVCAGMAARSLQKLATINLGYDPENVLLASFDLELQRYDGQQARQFQKTLLDEVRALPGVETAALSRCTPFDRSMGLRGGIGAEGQPPPDRDEIFLIGCIATTPEWLDTIKLPLLSGRALSEHDTAETTRVAVINTAVAAHFWPGEDPIGKRLNFGGEHLVEVVGLVGEARYLMLGDQARPLLFIPMAQQPATNVTLGLRTSGNPLLLARPLREIVQRLDANLPVLNVRTLEEQIAQSPLGLMPLRLGVAIAVSQGALVLLLAIMGLYGLVSFAVANRTREIGIRMALGATRRDILTLIARPSMTLTVIGLLAGLALAFLITRPLAGLLYGVAPNDILVFAGVPTLIIVVTVLAAWLPARRAVRINPTEALRAE